MGLLETWMGNDLTPDEAASLRIVFDEVDLRPHGKMAGPIVAWAIHASGDLDYVDTMVVPEAAVEAGTKALLAGAPVVTDAEMVRAGITRVEALCYAAEAAAEGISDLTRSAAAMRLAAARHPEGAVVVVGRSAAALYEVIRLQAGEGFAPALVVGVPAGFVDAPDAKESLRNTGMWSISNEGEKGGAVVAAAVVDGLARLAHRPARPSLRRG